MHHASSSSQSVLYSTRMKVPYELSADAVGIGTYEELKLISCLAAFFIPHSEHSVHIPNNLNSESDIDIFILCLSRFHHCEFNFAVVRAPFDCYRVSRQLWRLTLDITCRCFSQT